MEKQSDDEGWWRFLTLCTHLKTKEDFNEFFKLFLTIEERDAISNRYFIVKELLRGNKTQREIADEYGVSISKITRGSNSLKTIGEKLRKFLMNKIK